MTLEQLQYLGFDESYRNPEEGTITVRCSCCAALVINGVPCHERGCRNQGYECRECGCHIPAGEACDCMQEEA